jgi:hypothetical protein
MPRVDPSWANLRTQYPPDSTIEMIRRSCARSLTVLGVLGAQFHLSVVVVLVIVVSSCR